MDPEVRLFAEQQDGFLLTSQALARGTSKATLSRWINDEELVRLARGLSVLSTHLAQTPEARHLQFARGARLLMPDAVLGHWTAVLAHELPLLNVPRLVRLQRPIHRQVRRGGFVVDPLRGEPVETAHGPAVPAVDAVLDQARSCGLEVGLVSADAALRQGTVSGPDLVSRAEKLKGPQARVARRTAELADGAIESVGESRLRYTCLLGGIDVVPQAVIRNQVGEFVARVDFLVKDTKVAIEFDGKTKYADGDGRTLWNEKQREDALRRLGYTVVRVTWQDFEDLAALLARIREAVVSGRLLAG